MNWNLDWERGSKYKRLRLHYALALPSSIPLTYTQYVMATTKRNPCEYMRNLARCKRKRLGISYGLTRDSFLELMRSSYFQVDTYQMELNKAGDTNSGWCFMIRGYHLII
jgi:hypothetical protein